MEILPRQLMMNSLILVVPLLFYLCFTTLIDFFFKKKKFLEPKPERRVTVAVSKGKLTLFVHRIFPDDEDDGTENGTLFNHIKRNVSDFE